MGMDRSRRLSLIFIYQDLPGLPMALRVSGRLTVLPTSYRGAGRRFLVPGGRPGPVPRRLGNTGRAEQVGSDVSEPPADPGRGEAFGPGRLLPGPAEVGGQRPGEPELGVRDDQEPGPAVRRLGCTQFRGGPAERLLSEPESVLQVESPQEPLPPTVRVRRGGSGFRGPQPNRRRLPLLGEALDFKADQGALDDGDFTVVLQPGRAVGQPRVAPVPRLGFGLALVGGVGRRGHGRFRPRLGLGEAELRPVLGRAPALGVVCARRLR